MRNTVRRTLLGASLSLGILGVLGLGASPSAWAATSAPTLVSPANGVSNWLFNSGAGFTWSTLGGTTHQIVVSDDITFANFNSSISACTNPGCVAAQVNTTSAGRTQLAGYWFYGTGTYYWRVRSYSVAGGWSAWSGTRSFSTTSSQLRAVVNAALPFLDKASPQSTGDGIWETDMDPPPGWTTTDLSRYVAAMNVLQAYVNSKGGYATWNAAGRSVTQTVKDNMAALLTSYPSLSTSTIRSTIVAQMLTVYAGSVPSTENGMLSLMRIRAQCKEFADRMVIAGGLRARGYTATATTYYPRPGMYAFKTPQAHAGIIRAVSYSSSGVVSVRLIESNFLQAVWQNPPGQVPWLRTVSSHDQVMNKGGSDNYIAVEPTL